MAITKSIFELLYIIFLPTYICNFILLLNINYRVISIKWYIYLNMIKTKFEENNFGKIKMLLFRRCVDIYISYSKFINSFLIIRQGHQQASVPYINCG